jgi:phosphohistidine phosphatase
MKQLLLMRHAKSNWSVEGLSDFERSLNDRGHLNAQDMALYLLKNAPLPDYILCSTAQRTRETLGYLLKAYSHPHTVQMSRKIYEAPYVQIMEQVQAVPEHVQTLLVLGHNPGMEEMAFNLCGDGEVDAFKELRFKYPTAACAHISFNVGAWLDVTRTSGYLKDFVTPKTIETRL